MGGWYQQILGNFSYALYITSNCWSYLVGRLFPDWSYGKALAVYIALAVLCALACMATCALIGRLYRKCRAKIMKSIVIP